MANLNSMPPPQHDLLVHKCILHNLVFKRAQEYFWATRALAPLSFAPTSFNTTLVLFILHPQSSGFLPFFFKNYEPDQDFKHSLDFFKSTFQHMPHLFASVFSKMVFEHLQNCFQLEDFANGFPQLFQLCSHITQGVPCWITHILEIVHLLAMTKPLSEICPIVMGEALYWFKSLTLCFQFRDAFATHFPHIDLKLQPKANVKLWSMASNAFWTFILTRWFFS
jgi:hypothetical protein